MPARLIRLLCLLLAVLAAPPTFAIEPGSTTMRPSDCKPRDADSTCATAVAGATVVVPPTSRSDSILYDGPLGGVPSSGYAYWGFDFIADASGTPSPVRPDEFINRSGAPVTITLSFNIPTTRSCGNDCLPGVQFQVGPAWHKVDPPYVVKLDTVSLTSTFQPGEGYGWLIGLWESRNARLTVSVPKGAVATLGDVGLAAAPSIASELPRVVGTCECPDRSQAACSAGTHFSNGLLGAWYQSTGMYLRQGAFNDCTVDN